MDEFEETTFEERLAACIAEASASSGVSDGVASVLQGLGGVLLAKPIAASVVRKHAIALIEEAKKRDVVPPS